ncbi:hypothetical protein PMG11_06151 [Penicillium brasilianum]|uniref:C2H2-type domain-containing protein n=1 Tax=Penicillium brasilianum TaxID=104259 RepID=A0A0F7TLJ1_PENBI|nr:hypothetical protein PMG11_06151 [Penicillium brasilianum]
MPKARSRVKQQRLCPWCSLNFSKEEHLSRHIRSHTKEKPFGCVTCGKTFSRRDSLLRHSKVHSTQGKDSQTPNIRAPSLETDGNPDPTLGDSRVLPMDHGIDPTPSLLAHHESLSPMWPDKQATASHTQARLPEWLETVVQPSKNVQSQANPQGRLFTPLDNIFNLSMESALHFEPYSQVPTWLADEHFDLDALNSSVMTGTLGIFTPDYTANNDNTDTTIQTLELPHSERKEDQVRQLWFTYIGTHKSGNITPNTTQEQVVLDDQYRQTLSQRLQQRVPNEPLPSTEFLNLCIQLFFTKFNPIFPIVHAPTFRPSVKNSLLLLSICSVGSLFIGSKYAVTQGSIIFERLNKAILASWERYLLSGKGEAIAMIQAALIGQTFALLSGKPRNLLILQTFHGTVTTWARLYKMFEVRQATDHLEAHLETRSPEDSWRAWAQSEEQVRLAAGLHILDAELSELVLTHPLIQREESLLPLTGRHELWVASNTAQWKMALDRQRSASDFNQSGAIAGSSPLPIGIGLPNRFQLYITLEGINARIANSRASHVTRDQEVFTRFENQLIQFFDQHLHANGASPASDPFCLEVLWHSAFISLLADFNCLELAIGREGYKESLSHRDHAHRWASSPNATRCALHGAMILRKVQNTPLGSEPAIHVPRALYRAATVWYIYSEYGVDVHPGSPETSLETPPAVNVEFPEFSQLKMSSQSLIFEANGYRTSRPKSSESSTLCGLVDLLHRIGHWGLSRKFAEQLNFLLKETES